MRSNPRGRVYKYLPLFLTSTDEAMEWVKNFPELCDRVGEGGVSDSEMDEVLEERVSEYVDFARGAYARGGVTLYRAVAVPSYERLSLSRLGQCWSGRRSGARAYYGPSKEIDEFAESEPRFPVVLTATGVPPTHIDWSKSLEVFVRFGEDEWEVRLLPDVDVAISEIDGGEAFGKKVFSPPVIGNTGFLRDEG